MTTEKKSLDFCAVPNCHNYRNEYISLHRFPKDLELQNLWLEAVKLKTWSFAFRICSDHFLPQDFYLPGVTTMRRRLRSNIVPTKNLPSTYEYEKTACKPLILRRKTCQRKKDLKKNSVDKSQALELTESDQLDSFSRSGLSEPGEDFVNLEMIEDDINNGC